MKRELLTHQQLIEHCRSHGILISKITRTKVHIVHEDSWYLPVDTDERLGYSGITTSMFINPLHPYEIKEYKTLGDAIKRNDEVLAIRIIWYGIKTFTLKDAHSLVNRNWETWKAWKPPA